MTLLSETRTIPDMITMLSGRDVFVFGSNLQGQHHGGAARIAHEKFGAEWGVGQGPTGECYAIPTMHGGIEDIKPYVDKFTKYARDHPEKRFLVTRVGCGIAGFRDEEMAPLFIEACRLTNVNFSKEWLTIFAEKGIIPVPKAISEKELISFCKEYREHIGSGAKIPLPEIKIRYVIDTDEFGYANFGDFFMREDMTLYVWSKDKRFKRYHNQEMVEEIFNDECKKRKTHFFRKVIFAGVKTPYVDAYGKAIYSGDVLKCWQGDKNTPQDIIKTEPYTILHSICYFCGDYEFIDDNCNWQIPDFVRMERYGTVFYKLNEDEEKPTDLWSRCLAFDPWYHGIPEEERLLLAKYTPNFDKDLWQYYARDILKIKFKSNK